MYKMKLINLNNLKIGQYIDLISAKDDMIRITQILYNSDSDFSDVPYEYVNSLYYHFLKFKSNLVTSYPSLFTSTEGESKDDIYQKLGLEVEEEDEEESKDEESIIWFNILYNQICNGDFLKMREAYNLNVIEVFNFLTLKINKKI